jgi:hypothetical protein
MHDILIIINIKGGIELSYDLITPIARETHKMRYILRMTTKIYGVSNFSKRGGVGVLDRQTYQGGTRSSRLCGGDRDRETENSKVYARTRDRRFI